MTATNPLHKNLQDARIIRIIQGASSFILCIVSSLFILFILFFLFFLIIPFFLFFLFFLFSYSSYSSYCPIHPILPTCLYPLLVPIFFIAALPKNLSQKTQSYSTYTLTDHRQSIQHIMSTDGEFTRNQIFGTVFEVTNRYTELNPVGMGAFGLVCSAVDRLTGQNVAVKKVMKPFLTSVLAKRTYRELKLLKHLRHENLITLDDIFLSPLEDIYFVNELQGTDLHRLLTSRPLEKQFIQYFTYQILRGLKYIHSAGVIHRDLKPSNILINENCDLKICDFGLARIRDSQMTGYVSTRYYRAPEIMLTWQMYDTEVDIWSVGCILAEIIEGKPLFPGRDHVHQFSIITELLGSPPTDVISTILSENTLKFVQSLPHREPIPFLERFARCTHVEPEAIDLLEKMLIFDPKKRITAEEALAHPYMEPFHDPTDEPVCESKFDWSFNDADLPLDTWRVMMYSEILDFHQIVGDNVDPTGAISGPQE